MSRGGIVLSLLAGFALGAVAVGSGLGSGHADGVLRDGPQSVPATAAMASPALARVVAPADSGRPDRPEVVAYPSGAVEPAASTADGSAVAATVRRIPPSARAVLERTGQSEADYLAYHDALLEIESVRRRSPGCTLWSSLETDVRGRVEHFYAGVIEPRIPAGAKSEGSTDAVVQSLRRFHARALELLREQPKCPAGVGYRERARVLNEWRSDFAIASAELDVLARATELEIQRLLGAPRVPFASYLQAR